MRVLISIGCNAYDHISPLSSAELDARRMFEALIRPEIGEYDRERSRLLLSPTGDEVRQTIREVLFSNGAIDTFTFFFAGHGGVKSGSFYMCVRDTRLDALSVTAMSLSDLFRSLSETAPVQSNIIIDACQSGGLVADLGVLLKTDIVGDAGSPGITLVATSAQNESSGETEAGGLGTNAILDCIEGRDLVQDRASTLDLVEIGRRISSHFQGAHQSPVVWGLNLYGPPRFCRNPRYGVDPATPLRDVMQAWPSVSDESIRKHYDHLWRAYVSVAGPWNPREFSDVVTSIILPLASTPEVLCEVVERFGAAALERAQYSGDAFRQSVVAATLAVCLLPYIENETVAQTARRFLNATSTTLIAAGKQLFVDLETDGYALLAQQRGGLSDLFYLPLRVANVLGWIAALRWLYSEGDENPAEAEKLFAKLLRSMLDSYSGSIVTLSDAQAPYWAAALSYAIYLGLTDDAEELTGLLFHSFVKCRGQLARGDIPLDKVLDYLVARHANDFTQIAELIERPNESLTVLLRSAMLLNLDEVFDQSLWEIDGVNFSAYLCSDFSQFGADLMVGGENLIWAIGTDVFRVTDLNSTWPPSPPRPESELSAALAVLASLLYPNRIPWFCLDSLSAKSDAEV